MYKHLQVIALHVARAETTATLRDPRNSLGYMKILGTTFSA